MASASDAGSRPPIDALGVLLGQVAGGDQLAFGVLYDSVAGMVYAIVRRVVRDPTQSEDVAQDVMLEVWRLANRFDPGRGSARGWIATIAHRRAVDLVRSSEASRQRSESYGQATGPGGDFDVVVEEVVERHEHDSVRVVLAELTPLQRESIELAYFEGLTYRQVATRLDAPIGTVKTRIRDGMVRLRNALGVDDD